MKDLTPFYVTPFYAENISAENTWVILLMVEWL